MIDVLSGQITDVTLDIAPGLLPPRKLHEYQAEHKTAGYQTRHRFAKQAHGLRLSRANDGRLQTLEAAQQKLNELRNAILASELS